MMKSLEQAIDKIKALPAERQEAAADALELIAAQVSGDGLTPQEISGVKAAQEAVRQGKIASDDEVRDFFARFRS